MTHFQVYDRHRSYEWNYEHAPNPLDDSGAMESSGNGGGGASVTSPGSPSCLSAGERDISRDADAGEPDGTRLSHTRRNQCGAIDRPEDRRQWTFCGQPVHSPLGIAAGPLLNGRWLLHYAKLGYGVLTYKTVRSVARSCYPPPNLQPVEADEVEDGDVVRASDAMRGSWAISFGMPSRSPDVWARDVAWARSHLPAHQLLCVSVVASPQPDWPVNRIADDYAWCAALAAGSGADCIELNLSCPNVDSVDGQLYLSPRLAGDVAKTVRAAVPDKPLIAKIGFVADENLAARLVEHLAATCNALSMVNCLSCLVRGSRGWMFDGQRRGIGGDAIRTASLKQVQRFVAAVERQGATLKIIGVGGVSRPEHVHAFLDVGAESVQVATAAITNPRMILEVNDQLGIGGVVEP